MTMPVVSLPELPLNLMPSGTIISLRQQAEQFFTTSGTLYTQLFEWSPDGRQIVALSGVFSGLFYIGKMSGNDQELLERMGFVGTENISRAVLLGPYATPIKNTYIVDIQKKKWYVVWSNEETQESVQVYQKALLVDRLATEEMYQRYAVAEAKFVG